MKSNRVFRWLFIALVLTTVMLVSQSCGSLFEDEMHRIFSSEETEEGDPNLFELYDSVNQSYTYQYRFSNLAADHTVKFVFSENRQTIGIDPIADAVKMNLQPNPATSQVNLKLDGVTGMVNCALIDMSGRVVYNQSINAESNNVINLSNLAKGAYFVRITNNQFSKVEKLIVR